MSAAKVIKSETCSLSKHGNLRSALKTHIKKTEVIDKLCRLDWIWS